MGLSENILPCEDRPSIRFSQILILEHNGSSKEAKEDRRVYQQQVGFGYEIRQIPTGIQKDLGDLAHGKGQIGDHCQQHSSSQVSLPFLHIIMTCHVET